jgi:hypothetical protein
LRQIRSPNAIYMRTPPFDRKDYLLPPVPSSEYHGRCSTDDVDKAGNPLSDAKRGRCEDRVGGEFPAEQLDITELQGKAWVTK